MADTLTRERRQIGPPGLYEIQPEFSVPAELRLDTTAFLGLVSKAIPPELEWLAVDSWGAFVAAFGPPGGGRLLPQAVYQYFLNGGQRAVIVPSLNQSPTVSRAEILSGLDALDRVDDQRPTYDQKNQTRPIALIIAPDLVHFEETEVVEDEEDPLLSFEDLRFHKECLPAAALKARPNPSRWSGLSAPISTRDLLPYLHQLREAAERGRRTALIDLPPNLDCAAVELIREELESSRVALYAPWIMAPPAEDPQGDWRPFPPSGAVAGRIAWTERVRGVGRAPANLPILGARALYRDPYLPSPGVLYQCRVNLIRDTPQGPTLLGSHTAAADSDREWIQIGARRLIDWLCVQLALDARWAAFEPNERRLWRRLELTANRRLSALFHAHAFAGATPKESYFVRCDRDTNPSESQDAGRVVVTVGVAPASPAEFIVFQLSLMRDGTSEVSDA